MNELKAGNDMWQRKTFWRYTQNNSNNQNEVLGHCAINKYKPVSTVWEPSSNPDRERKDPQEYVIC